jgi:hypothetical protein
MVSINREGYCLDTNPAFEAAAKEVWEDRKDNNMEARTFDTNAHYLVETKYRSFGVGTPYRITYELAKGVDGQNLTMKTGKGATVGNIWTVSDAKKHRVAEIGQTKYVELMTKCKGQSGGRRTRRRRTRKRRTRKRRTRKRRGGRSHKRKRQTKRRR